MKRAFSSILGLLVFTLAALSQTANDPNEGSRLSYDPVN